MRDEINEGMKAAMKGELPMLYRVARRFVASQDDAEDMVQQTLIKAFKNWDRFDGQHVRAWLVRILRNEVLMARRGPSPAVSIEDVGEHEFVEPPFWSEVLWRDRAGQLMRAIDELPEIHRLLVQLCDIEGLTYEEAAQAVDAPVGTVRSRLFRARASLREKLGPRLGQILGVEG